MIALLLFAAPLHLSEVLARVEVDGPEQRLVSAQVPVARADIHTARMFPNPGFFIGGGLSEPKFDAGVQLRLPIFGQRGAHIRAAERGAEQVAEEASAARWRLRHDARIAYWNVVRGDDEVAIAVELETLTRRIAEIARERFEVGAGTRLDERQAELVHVRALQDVSDRRALARVARLELARQLGAPVDGPLADPLAGATAAPPVDELLTEARGQHPELRAAQKERLAALARIQAARADRRPSLTVDLTVELLDPSTCNGERYCVGPRGGLGLDLPLFNWNGGPIERARAETRLAELRAMAIVNRIEAGIRSAWENLRAAEARARFFDREYLPNAVEVEAMAREAFSVGRSGILPLIEAERAVLDARLGRTEALYAVQAARADLEEQSGVKLAAP
jgi:cobalt-zinc-cadmium efflux system outer membrane protein